MPVPQPPTADPARERFLNLRVPDARDRQSSPSRPEMFTMTASTGTGTAGGYTVYTQRRSQADRRMLCLRMDAPDGRVVHLAVTIHSTASSSTGPAARFFGGHLAWLFRPSRTAEQDRLVQASLTAVFAEAWQAAAWNPWPLSAQQRIVARLQGAAGLMSEADQDAWLGVAPWFSAVMDGTVQMRDLVTLHAAGFTPMAALQYYVNLRQVRGVASTWAATDVVFASDGWTYEQVGTLLAAVDPGNYGKPPAKAWAALGPDDALTVARAGLSPREFRAMRARGNFDMDTVRAMAALRSGVSPEPVF